jgi:hypothetical protein
LTRGFAILGLDPATVTHSGSGQAFAVRCWLGFARSGFLPAAVCPSTGRARGILAYVCIRVASGKPGIQHRETGEDHGVHGDKNNDAMGTRPLTARSAQILFCSVDSVVLACFSVLKPLLSVLRMPRAKKCACRRIRPEDLHRRTRRCIIQGIPARRALGPGPSITRGERFRPTRRLILDAYPARHGHPAHGALIRWPGRGLPLRRRGPSHD